MMTLPGSQSYCEYSFLESLSMYILSLYMYIYIYIYTATTRDGHGRECDGDGKCLSSTKGERL
jgi:hypothetical protein